MGSHQHHGSPRHGRGHDLADELFGRGALRRADSSPTSGTRGTPVPWWIRLGALSAGTGAGGHVLSTWAIPAIPPGGTRDELREALTTAATYAPATSLTLAAGTVAGAGWWWRQQRAQRRETTLAERRKNPTPCDRAAAVAAKLPVGSVQATVHYRPGLPRRRVHRVVLHAPPGALTDNPGRACAEALSPIVGTSLRPDSWTVATGTAVLVPGELPPVDEDALPPVATDPVARTEQVLRSVLGKSGEHLEPAVLDRHDDGTPRAFTVRHAPTAKLSTPERREMFGELLAGHLTAGHGGRGYHVTADPAADVVRVVEKPPMEHLIPRPLYDEREVHGDRDLLAVGQDEHGTYVGWDLSPNCLQPHGLLVGPTGLGKTSLLRSIIVAASRYGFDIKAADPKRIELQGLTQWPGCTTLAARVDDIRALIHETHDEMDRRYTRVERRQVHAKDLQPLLVLLDEYYILRTLLEFAHRQEGRKGTPEDRDAGADSGHGPCREAAPAVRAAASRRQGQLP